MNTVENVEQMRDREPETEQALEKKDEEQISSFLKCEYTYFGSHCLVIIFLLYNKYFKIKTLQK